MSAWVLPAAAVSGYALGSVSPATVLARRRGVDLRGVGSGNPGATNAGRAMGRRVGAVVALLDLVKGFAAAALWGVAGHGAALLAGLAAVVGHISSPLLRGRGGKGVAAAAGAVLGVHPVWGALAAIAWLVVLGLGRWVALASVVATASVAVVAAVLGTDVAWAVALAGVVVARHVGNFRVRPWPGRVGP